MAAPSDYDHVLQELTRERKLREQAESRLREAESQLRERESQLQAAEQETQLLSLPDFLEACHTALSVPLRVQTDRKLTTKGSTTKSEGKKHPRFLRPWQGFPQLHTYYFDEAYRVLCGDGTTTPPNLFTPRLALERIGIDACSKLLGSERDLEWYYKTAVEDRIQEIMNQLISMASAQQTDESRASMAQHLLNGCSGIVFENHLNSLSEHEEVERNGPWSKIDQACIFRHIGGQRGLCFVREYKPPHKLPVEYLRAGLRPMDVREEVVLRVTIPIDHDEKLKYNADKLVASVVTQTYEYMIDNGLEYSSVATGEAEVFLWIPYNESHTVHYYLTEPRRDVIGDGEYEFRIPFTAISRLLGFTLMALKSKTRDQAWRDAAGVAGRWTADEDDILRKMSDDERRETPPGSDYSSPLFPVSPRSPYLLRSRRQRTSTDEPFPSSISSSQSDDHSQDEPPQPDTPTPLGPRSDDRLSKRKGRSDHYNPGSGPGPGSAQTRACCAYPGAESAPTYAYCTMRCLMGVKFGRVLDPACPNYQHHQQGRQNDAQPSTLAQQHELDATALAHRLKEQLDHCRDHYCTPLFIPGGRGSARLQGAHGAMFKITLASHGYTFMAKGTIDAFVKHLRREGEVYDWLVALQGSATPVHLGNIDLRRPYYDIGQKIVYMLLLAWGGDALDDETPSNLSPEQLKQEKKRSIRDINKYWIIHDDLRLPNMLWNNEIQRVLIIDLEGCTVKAKAERDYSRISDGLEQLTSVKRRAVPTGQLLRNRILQRALRRSTAAR